MQTLYHSQLMVFDSPLAAEGWTFDSNLVMRAVPAPGHSDWFKYGPIRTSETQLWVFGPIEKESLFFLTKS